MVKLNDIEENIFKGSYYDEYYFADEKGKEYILSNGTKKYWGYRNKTGEFRAADIIAKAWKTIFKPSNLLDVGAGRGQFIHASRTHGIKAEGFDFSEWAVSDDGRYHKCKKEWLILHDATEKWPYPDNSFDLVIALDLFEHIYHDDLQFVIDELYRVARKWIFLQIAVSGTGGLQGRDESGYILKKGVPIPIGFEGCAVAGHVTLQTEDWWIEKFNMANLFLRRDLLHYFVSEVGSRQVENWILNSILIYEIMED